MSEKAAASQGEGWTRRRWMQVLGTVPLWSGVSVLNAQTQQSQSNLPQATADAWRAMSRVGYGPTPWLAAQVEAQGGARNWAMGQVQAAYIASQSPPSINPEWKDFNEPLPELFARARMERQTREQRKADTASKQKSDKRELLTGDSESFSRSVVLQAAAWRLSSCSEPEHEVPLLARLTEFWFNHFNVFNGKGAVRPFVGHYAVHVARTHALGKFEDLLLASARHPAMLLYLDQAQSVADGTVGTRSRGLNENYARELLELHTLGVHGGYAQKDVRELARILTGWTVNPKSANGFHFASRVHDAGPKTLLGQAYGGSKWADGEQEGIAALRMLARHPQTAQRISRRLAEFFIADQPSESVVRALANRFLESGGDLKIVMRTLLSHPDFWASNNSLFKTPMDFACSALAATASGHDTRHLLLAGGFLANAGQPVHGWQTPDGYPFDAATWMVPEALTRRADFALALARQADTRFLSNYVSNTTLERIARESPGLTSGLLLASPDFMRK